jgi:phosphoribosyl 1,2-cyclic phosphate phosphodiesterase
LIDDNPFCIDGVEIVPIRARHYKLPVLGYRFGNFAYLTDANAIPEQEYDKLRGLDLFVISTVREKRHISHFTLSEALAVAQRVGAKRTLLTHMSHQLPRYELLKDMLPAGVEPAYDGLIINI